MDKNQRLTLLAIITLALAVAGCSTAEKHKEPPPAPAPVAAKPAPPPPAPAPAPKPAYIISDVNFDFDKAKLTPAASGILDEAAAGLLKQSGVPYEVSGYTDTSGDETYNQGLSERRADAVRDYLVGHGVPADQLKVVGYGEANPIADNGTREGRAINRRVEIRPVR